MTTSKFISQHEKVSTPIRLMGFGELEFDQVM